MDTKGREGRIWFEYNASVKEALPCLTFHVACLALFKARYLHSFLSGVTHVIALMNIG